MKPIPEGREKRERKRVETLLRAAAHYAPETPAPEGFAMRVLARSAVNCSASALPRRLALALGCLGLLIVSVSLSRQRSAINGQRVGALLAAPSAVSGQRSAAFEPRRTRRTAQRPTPNTQHPTPNAQRPTPNAQRPTPNSRPATPPPLKARWQEQTVRRYARGLLAPAWVIRADEEEESVIATPAVLRIPLEVEEEAMPTGDAEENPETFQENIQP